MELWELAAREACRDTLAQYNHAGDRYLLEEFAAAFCEERRARDPWRGTAAGSRRHHGALRRRDRGDARSPGGRPDHGRRGRRRIVRHSVTNIRFESVTPTEATLASYFTVFTEIGLDHMGALPGPPRPRGRAVADRAPLRVDGLALARHHLRGVGTQ